MATPCSHVPEDRAPPAPSADGCEDCLRMGTRNWVHLRICQQCGHVGCCDQSPGRHASAHHGATHHPLVRSFEPGEDWWWCYVDVAGFYVPGSPPAPSYA